MATEKFANSASTTLATGIGSDDLSLVVADASAFPTQPQFRILLESEILLVTGVSGTTFTVTRGEEGTTPTSHGPGLVITQLLTAGALAQLQVDIQGALRVYSGTGDPEGVLTATVGTMYLRTDGGVGTTLYIKETGSGNTGWVAK
jgi:hypothetical protein